MLLKNAEFRKPDRLSDVDSNLRDAVDTD